MDYHGFCGSGIRMDKDGGKDPVFAAGSVEETMRIWRMRTGV